MTQKYGALPELCGQMNIQCDEMMFWMYLPVKIPNRSVPIVPTQLQHARELLYFIAQREERWRESYVYLTFKTVYATKSNPGNRPGWHSDGFGTDDINYIWYDRAPTEFYGAREEFELPPECDDAIAEMTRRAEKSMDIFCYPPKEVIRLTPANIHRVSSIMEPGMRTFIKVSISRHKYNLLGNSINYQLPETHWPLLPREGERNHPCKDSY